MDAKKKEEDVFDRLVHWATKYKYMKWFAPIYARFKEFLLYALMGLGTVIIAIWTYSIFTEILGWHILVGNAVSWVFATAFAFFSNRKWVFTSRDDGVGAFFYQLFTFSFGRFLTLLLEEWILNTFVLKLGWPNMPVKYFAQIVVIVANYLISKLLVFSSGRSRAHVLIHGHRFRKKLKETEESEK